MLSGSSSSQPFAISGSSVAQAALFQTAVARPAVGSSRGCGLGPKRLAIWLKPGLWPQMSRCWIEGSQRVSSRQMDSGEAKYSSRAHWILLGVEFAGGRRR